MELVKVTRRCPRTVQVQLGDTTHVVPIAVHGEAHFVRILGNDFQLHGMGPDTVCVARLEPVSLSQLLHGLPERPEHDLPAAPPSA